MRTGKKMMRRVRAGLLAGGLILPALAGAATSGTITIPFTITNRQTTCDLAFNGQQGALHYRLGSMTPGARMSHVPFTVSTVCQGGSAVKTAITARMAAGGSGVLQSGSDSIRLKVGAQSAADDTSPLFWLQTQADGRRVRLTGQEGDAFCHSVGAMNDCRLTPVTDIPARSPSGNIDVTIQFNVVYPQ